MSEFIYKVVFEPLEFEINARAGTLEKQIEREFHNVYGPGGHLIGQYMGKEYKDPYLHLFVDDLTKEQRDILNGWYEWVYDPNSLALLTLPVSFSKTARYKHDAFVTKYNLG